MDRFIVEKDDKYILPLEGKTVLRCCVDNRFSIIIPDKEDPEVGVQIAGMFLLIEKGREQKFSIE